MKVLALRAGVTLEPINREAADAKERLHAVMEAAVTYFVANLEKTPGALAYLKERGLNSETISSFRLGLATVDWRGLTDYLLGRNFTERDLDHSGLVARSNRGARIFDRFRHRIMFPITDSAGRTIAFSGRLFSVEPTVTPTSTEAKYINSPDTLLYDKSRTLYLFDRAKLAMRRIDRCVLVEGQFDAVLSHQAGIAETVAVSGTALSGFHLDLIRRLTKKIIMAFDGDAAGIKASNRAIILALERGLEVQVVTLPNDKDPADVIRESKVMWEKSLGQTFHVIDFLITVIKRRGLGQREMAHQIEEEVYPYLSALANPIDQAYFIKNIADLVELPEAIIRDGVSRTKVLKTNEPMTGKTSATVSSIAPLPTRRNRLETLILGFVAWQGSSNEGIKTSVIKYWGKDLFDQRRSESRERESEQALMAEITYGGVTDLATALSGLLNEWREETWREELAETVRRLKSLDPKTESKLLDQYLKRCQELSQQLNNKP